jgi:thermitase
MTQPAIFRKILTFSVLFITSFFLIDAGQIRKTARPAQGSAAEYAPGEILVKFKPDVPTSLREAVLASSETRAVRRLSRLDVFVVRIPDEASVEELAYVFQRNPHVQYAEPNYLCRASVTPNDLLFKYQYGLSNSGQMIGTVPGSPQGQPSADIKAPQAWEETTGTAEVVIAILDSGVDFGHPDLKTKLVSTGRDFVNNDLDATDDYFHGTAVAGIAAAATNNNEGIAGVAWNARILPVKVLNSVGVGTTDQVADGIRWAADQGAQVLNLSLGADAPSQTLRNAVQYAFEKGCVLVAAAGNGGGAVQFPAAYDTFVLAVAATDYNDVRQSTSNFGAEIDVAAPGVQILSTVPTWLLGPSLLPSRYDDGTSLAAPHVAGLAALLKGRKPWLKPAEIMEIIRLSADDVNAAVYPGKDEYVGYGRINMERALVPLKIPKDTPIR